MVQVRCIHCGTKVSGKNGDEISGGSCQTCWVLYKLRRWFKREAKSRRYINTLIAEDINQLFLERKRGE